jgi:hypothetical protein
VFIPKPKLWAELTIPDADFDIIALHQAIDAKRVERRLSWSAVAHEVNRAGERNGPHPISPSTISGLKNRRWGVEGDGVLQMLLWLGRSPESFVPGHPGAMHPDAQLPPAVGDNILRFDVPSIYARLDARRLALGLNWSAVAEEVGRSCNAEQLKSMRKQQRTGFPQVMRLARWLHCPAAHLTHLSFR